MVSKKILLERIKKMKFLDQKYDKEIFSKMIAEAMDMGSKTIMSTVIMYDRHKRFTRTIDIDPLGYTLFNPWDYANEQSMEIFERLVESILMHLFLWRRIEKRRSQKNARKRNYSIGKRFGSGL